MADTWVTTQLPDAILGVPYQASLSITPHGSAVTTGSVATGALPPGLTLTAANCVISGTPTTAGVYTCTVSLTDTAGATVSGTLTIVVRDAGESDRAGLNSLGQLVAAEIARVRLK